MDGRCHSQNLTSAVALGMVGVIGMALWVLLLPSAAWIAVCVSCAPLLLALQPLAARRDDPERQMRHAILWCRVAGSAALALGILDIALLVVGWCLRQPIPHRETLVCALSVSLGTGAERMVAGHRLRALDRATRAASRQRNTALAHTVIGDSPWLR